jgi:membrane protein DedA with SNARE-associated domain
MKYLRFILFDGLAAMISAPAFVYLGHYFGEDLHSVIVAVKKGQTRVLIGVAVVIVGYIIVSRWRAAREKAKEKAVIAAGGSTLDQSVPPTVDKVQSS